jgi:membrane-associated phospholipid phosphatase
MSTVRPLRVLALVVLVSMGAAEARGATEKDDGKAPPLSWSPRHRRFQGLDYAGTLALGATFLTLQLGLQPPAQPRFSGGVFLDGFARDHLRATSAAGRKTAGRVSDLFWYGSLAFPFLIDAPVAATVRGSPDVAGQMVLMNAQAFAVAAVVDRTMQLTLGRGRPGRDECNGPRAAEYSCGDHDAAVSMPSGHTMIAATAAGLTCVHHRYLPLWGSTAADRGACVIMIAATAVTGTTRVVADRHHLSDVLVGAALGFSIGYGTPWLLHYRSGARGREHEGLRAVFIPMVDGRTVGAAAAASF